MPRDWSARLARRSTRCCGTSPPGTNSDVVGVACCVLRVACSRNTQHIPNRGHTMTQYLIRRLLVAIPTLLVISMVVYAILALAPTDPLSQFAANPAVPAWVRENIRHQMGLDQPWY